MHAQTNENARGTRARKLLLAVLCSAVFGCEPDTSSTTAEPFTIIMLPDTQTAIDFTRQRAAGFVINSSDLFLDQMHYIADRAQSNGGDVVFVASVGDVWQHISSDMDAEHAARGISAVADPEFGTERWIEPEATLNFEIPKAIEGYKILSQAGVPFGVAPGNHDYDAWWEVDAPHSAAAVGAQSSESTGRSIDRWIHIGGLSNFRAAFGADTDFFRDKDWYVSGFEGGGSSAQVFSAGGYRFLHLAFEMQAGNDVVDWAREVIDDYPGLPTIISTHDYLNPRGERLTAGRMDLALVDPDGNNSAEELWQDFISSTGQIFMVLSGHQVGQAVRVDLNEQGHEVYQILADYQVRAQAALDAGAAPARGRAAPMTGDGWLRELTFHLDQEVPELVVRTYSSHYDSYSSELETYAQWYKEREQPEMTDEEFLAADEFTIPLNDFYRRFGD